MTRMAWSRRRGAGSLDSRNQQAGRSLVATYTRRYKPNRTGQRRSRRMHQRLLRSCRAMPLPPPPPRTPGISAGRLFASLPTPPPLQSRREIGVDIEEKKRKTAKSALSLARRYFTPSEVDYLVEISDSDAQQKEFIKLWTLKEAYVKALGRGFSGAPFNRFSILLGTSKGIQISKAPKVCNDFSSGCDDLSENCQFALAELNNSHYMAVCLEDDSRIPDSENGPVPLGLKVWKTIPFVEDTLVSETEAVKLIG